MIKIIKGFSLFIFLFGVSGCASTPYNYFPESEYVISPPIGEVATARLGDSLLEEGDLIKSDSLRIRSEGSVAFYKILPGNHVKVGERDGYEYYQQPDGANLILTWPTRHRASNASLKVDSAQDEEVCVIRPADLEVCSDLNFERKTSVEISPEGLRKTLIYSGRVGDRLKVGYREFSNNMARSAFSNEVEYDLSEGRVIGYSGAELEVIEASNTSITYRVLSGFR